jgi:putative ABC transport system permease protein
MKESGTSAGADFFRMFSYPLLEGTPVTALSTPSSLAISRKMAVAFFGSPRAAIGKAIRNENKRDLTVTAVYEDLPAITSDKFDYVLNWFAFLDDNSWAKDWGNNGPHTVLLLRKDANAALVNQKITHFLDKYNKEQSKAFRIELGMSRFADIYLHSNFTNGKIDGGRIEYVRLFSIVAIFILCIACINFMNLTTARSVKRAKEIGIRKVVGAVRPALIRQFIGEAVLLAFFSVVLALGMVMLMLPGFNMMTGHSDTGDRGDFRQLPGPFSFLFPTDPGIERHIDIQSGHCLVPEGACRFPVRAFHCADYRDDRGVGAGKLCAIDQLRVRSGGSCLYPLGRRSARQV